MAMSSFNTAHYVRNNEITFDIESNGGIEDIDAVATVVVQDDAIIAHRKVTVTPTSPENAPIILSWMDVDVHTIKDNKHLLRNVSGSITGGFWAIMGASGSGKTTLLSTLSFRLDQKSMKVSGEFVINGYDYSKSDLKAMSAYVMQDDVLHSELTVQETLNYAAELRLPTAFTKSDRDRRKQEVLELMELTHCQSTKVGNSRRTGISVGERKRLCVAMELLSKPKLLFLDEPTSGLDSSMALRLITVLKRLSDRGDCTVVCTIHQPQQKLFEMFDNLILMKQGEIVYQGSCSKSIRFLETIGLPCPAGVNPADHLIEVLSPNIPEAELVNEVGRELQVPIDLTQGSNRGFIFGEGQTKSSWTHQFRVLTRRNFLQWSRHPDIVLLNAVATTLIAVFIGGGIWHNLGNDQNARHNLPAALFFGCVTQGIFASLQCVNSFPSERAVMLRERASGSYYISAYFSAKTVVDITTQLWQPILFSCIVYPLLGFQPTVSKFFVFMMFMILDSMAAISLAIAVSTLCVSIERSTVLLSLLFEISRLFGGFFTSPEQLKHFPSWRFADAFSYIKYCYVGVALNEFHGMTFTCTEDEIAKNLCVTTGTELIAANGLDQYSIGTLAGSLVYYIIIARLIGYICLRFIKS